MKTHIPILAALTLSIAAFTQTLPLFAADDVEPGFTSLFNGKDLTDWEGRKEHWSVEDVAITGKTTRETPARGNNFLVWRGGTVDDFELRLSYKIVPNNDKGFGNSGIQYRSKELPNFVVGGYQADFEAGKTYSGILYEERGRGILAQRGQMTWIQPDGKIRVVGSLGKSEEIQAQIKQEDWNDYVVIARGNHLMHIINGRVTVDVTDDQESKAAKSGILALQLHAGDPMTVQFKNIRIKKLSGSGVARSDLDQLQGNWEPVEFVVNGNKLDADALAAIKVKIKGNGYVAERADGQDEGTFKLLETATPKSMDITSGNGTEIPAIYQISGDTFKACYGPKNASRPTTFEAPEGSKQALAIYKRKAQ